MVEGFYRKCYIAYTLFFKTINWSWRSALRQNNTIDILKDFNLFISYKAEFKHSCQVKAVDMTAKKTNIKSIIDILDYEYGHRSVGGDTKSGDWYEAFNHDSNL